MELCEIRVEGLVFVIDLDAMTSRARMLQPGAGWVEISLSGRDVIDLARRESHGRAPDGEPHASDRPAEPA